MDCEEIREQLLKGRPADAEMARHAENCPVCSELLADEGRTARALAETSHRAPDVDALLSAMTKSLESERGIAGALRSLPTRGRWVLATIAGITAGALTLVLIPRVDLAVYPPSRMVLIVAMILVTLAAAVRIALWPLHEPLPNVRTTIVIGVVAMLVPIVYSALPAAHWAHPASMHGVGGEELFPCAGRCFFAGMVLGAPFLFILRALDRSAHAVARSALVAAAATGLSSNLALQMHCPLTHPNHLLLGHATVGIAIMALYGSVTMLRRRRA